MLVDLDQARADHRPGVAARASQPASDDRSTSSRERREPSPLTIFKLDSLRPGVRTLFEGSLESFMRPRETVMMGMDGAESRSARLSTASSTAVLPVAGGLGRSPGSIPSGSTAHSFAHPECPRCCAVSSSTAFRAAAFFAADFLAAVFLAGAVVRGGSLAGETRHPRPTVICAGADPAAEVGDLSPSSSKSWARTNPSLVAALSTSARTSFSSTLRLARLAVSNSSASLVTRSPVWAATSFKPA